MAARKGEYLGEGMLKDELRPEIAKFLLTQKEHFIQLYGGRGPGKSYTTQKTIIEHCLANNVEFCLTVPTKKLMDRGALKKWVRKVMFYEFPQLQTRYTTEYLYVRRNEEESWQLLGHCLALSGADEDSKNDSSLFNVQWLVWDEAMRQKLEASAAEILIDLFLTTYHTIDRDENRVTAIFLGNALNKLDPLYALFGVTMGDLDKPGLIKRTFNRVSWNVPVPPDVENDDNNEFRKMVKGTRYGDIASGHFSLAYGDLIKEPAADETVNSVYAIEFTDDGYLLIMPANGVIYIEACNKEFAQKYAQKTYTAVLREARRDKTVVPMSLIMAIRKALSLGKCKFTDEESLLTGATRLKTCYNIAIL